jgi:hypothetical protein
MPKYRYLVINPENKQLEGTVSAPDEEAARHELNQLGFSVISITETAEEAEAAGKQMPVFEFAATDKNGRHIVGTIQSADRYSAYKRLISEYSFAVEYVIDDKLDEASKQAERLKGALDLHDMLAEEQMLLQKKETGEEKDMKEFARTQEVLKSQINFVLNKVKDMLDQYEKDMKPETKAKIRYFVDKLMRIKTSTNLDYIRKTAEELLDFLQKEELFLNEQAHVRDRTKMLVEAKSLTMQLKRSKTKKNISFTDGLRQWRQEHIYDNRNPSLADKIENAIISIFIGTTIESEEILELRREIATTTSQIWQYLRLYSEAGSPEFKAETKEGLKRLFNERKKLKNKLKEAKKHFYKAQAEGREPPMQKFTLELQEFSGWLLAFYLLYYFISIYVSSKDFGLQQIPGYFFVYRSSFLKYFLAVIFLLHGALSVKIVFFRRNEIAAFIISPIFILASLLIILNF